MPLSLVQYASQTSNARHKHLIQKVTNEGVFLRLLNFIPVNGLSYTYSEFSKLPGVQFRGINEQYTEDTGVVSPKQEKLAILGGEARVDRILNGFDDGRTARASVIMAKARRASLEFDRAVIHGDSGTNKKEFDGLKVRLTGKQIISAGTNGGALTLDLLDQLVDAVVGPNSKKILLMSKADRRKLASLLLAAAGGAAVGDVGGEIPTYGGARVETLDEDGDDVPILAKNETQGSSNVTSSIYCIRPGSAETDEEFMQGLVGARPASGGVGGYGGLIDTYESGMQGTQHVDIVEANLGLALFHGRAAARLKGVL